MTPKEFSYSKWFESPPLNPKVGKLPDNHQLHEPAQIFLSNMGRVQALGRLPFALVTLGISKGQADVLSRSERTSIHEVHQSLQKQKQWLDEIQSAAKHLATQAADSTDSEVQRGYQALVAAIVMMSYAALESLMIDSCVVAIGVRTQLIDRLPRDVAGRVRKGRHIGRKNLNQFRQIFEQLFPEEADRPLHNLSKTFAYLYEGLLVLEAARNLYAHRCGIVDQRFQELVKTSRALNNLRIGDELFMNFEIARAQAGLARDFGVFLIKFVDWWVNTHPAI